MTAAVVLIVEHDPDLRDRMGRWLEEAGCEVVCCPGPSYPDYSCVAARGVPCALAHAADLVVMDLWLDSDRAMRGTSSAWLLRHYLRSGKAVIGISSGHDRARLEEAFVEDDVLLLDWPPERRELMETVRAAVAAKGKDGGRSDLVERDE